MPTPTKGPRLGGSPSHEKLMLANMSANLFEHRAITTTLTKAKRLRPYAERLITMAKQGDIAARRRVVSKISANSATHQAVVHELFTVIAPAMAERQGGYTRIVKIGNRKGDNAPMAVIELVMEPVSPKQAVVKEAEQATTSTASAEQDSSTEVNETAAAENTAAEAQSTETTESETAETSAPEAAESEKTEGEK